jgi:hypothetical protein
MDLDDRVEELKLIEKAIDYKFNLDGNDWPIINSRAESWKGTPDDYDMDKIPQEYIDFYEDTRL